MTDTNQASEDELQDLVEDLLLDWLNLQPRPNDYVDDAGYDEASSTYVDLFAEKVIALIRTEKLKLLDEVRERVVGEDEKPDGLSANKNSKKNLRPMYKNQLRAEQRIALTKLEAEL